MNPSHIRLAFLAALALALAPLGARAQTPVPSATRSAGTIEGAVFLDTNGNGAYDVEEAGVAGVSVRLTGPGADRTDSSDDSGMYRFTGIGNGTYTVTIQPEAPYIASDRSEYAGLDVAGDTLTSVDFALEKSASAAADEAASATATDRPTATGIPTEAATEAVTEQAGAAASATPWPSLAPATAAPLEAATLVPYATPMPVAPAMAEQMPQTGFEDLGAGTLLAGAMVLLLLVAGLGWMMERRG